MGKDHLGKIFPKKISDQILAYGKVVYTFYLLTNSSRVLNCQRQGSPSGVLSAPRRQAAPLLRGGGSERRPSPCPRDMTSPGRGGARGMLGLVVGPPLLQPSAHPPSSTPHPPTGAQARGEGRGECAQQNCPGPVPLKFHRNSLQNHHQL